MTEKRRNLGIDILCCLAGILLLGVCLFSQIGLEQVAVTDYFGALPIAARWFCMSGAMLLAACTGYVLSVRRFSASYFKVFGRLLYIYLVGSLCAIAVRCFLIGEEMTPVQILQSIFGFSASAVSHITGMYFLLLFAAPFLNAAFHDLKSRNARLAFVIIPAAFGTLQPILQFGEITVIPQWCIGLAPIAAYLGGAFIRRHSKRRDIVFLTIFTLVLFAAQTVIALFTSLGKGYIDCPWLDSMATLPCLLVALCLVGLFRSKQEKTGTAHRFFGGAAGGVLMGLMIAEPLMQCLMLNMVDSFPIISTRLVAGIVIVPLVFIMCTALSLMLQFPILLFRQARGDADEYEEEPRKKPANRKKKRAPRPVTEKETPAEKAAEIEEEPEVIEEEPEVIEEEIEEDEPDADSSEPAPEIPDEEPEETEEPEDIAEESEETVQMYADLTDAEEAEAAQAYETDRAEDEYDEDEYDDAEPAAYGIDEEDEEDEEEAPPAPVVSISLPHRTSMPLPQASENSSRHTITVPVSQPETQIRLTQPPPEPPIGMREVRIPARPQAYEPPPAVREVRMPVQPAPAPEPEPAGFETRSYTLDEILTEQGIPVKHMPETVDDLIAELTK